MYELEKKKSIRTGIFVLIGIAIFLVGFFFIGRQDRIFSDALTLHASFREVNGLQAGNNVWLSGVKIGTVKRVAITSDTSVAVVFRVESGQEQFIRQDASLSISTEGIIGNKLLVITPGAASQTIQDGDTLRSLENSQTQDLLTTLQASGQRISALADELTKIAHKIDDGPGPISELLNDTGMAKALKQSALNLHVTSARTARVTGDIQHLVNHLESNQSGVISTILTDTTFSEVYHQTLGNVKVIGEHAAEVTGDFSEFTQQAQHTDNALGVILADTTFAGNLRRIARQAAEGSASIAEDAQALQHSFLLRGAFRRMKKRERKAQQ